MHSVSMMSLRQEVQHACVRRHYVKGLQNGRSGKPFFETRENLGEPGLLPTKSFSKGSFIQQSRDAARVQGTGKSLVVSQHLALENSA